MLSINLPPPIFSHKQEILTPLEAPGGGGGGGALT